MYSASFYVSGHYKSVSNSDAFLFIWGDKRWLDPLRGVRTFRFYKTNPRPELRCTWILIQHENANRVVRETP